MKTLRTCFLIITASWAVLGWGQPGAVAVTGAWVRAAPPGAMVMAGYAVLRNTGTHALNIESVTSPQFSAVEMHGTIIENGVARMVQQQVLTLPAGGELTLAPGGLHLMLMQPNKLLRPGDRVELILHLDDGSTLSVDAAVKMQP